MNPMVMLAGGFALAAIVFAAQALWLGVRGSWEDTRGLWTGAGLAVVGVILSGPFAIHNQREVNAINSAEKPYAFCAVVTKMWQTQTGGSLLEPLATHNIVGFRATNGQVGATEADDATYGVVKAGDTITVRHQKTPYIVPLTGEEVWADVLTEGCDEAR